MASGTIAPWIYEQFCDSNGNPLNGGKIYTYLAGTSTPVATYTDVALSVPFSNPIILNSAGRPASSGTEVPIFLTPGVSYKFDIRTSADVSIVVRDNIVAVPGSSSTVDVTGTAGENITADQWVYLSDGSGGKTAGQWFKADNANPYSSTTNDVGIAQAAITAGTAGTITKSGRVPGLSGLSLGTKYWIGSAGALVSSEPANNAQLVGEADSATSMIVFGRSPLSPRVNCGICEGRLTLTTGTPITTADVTAATTLYFTPYQGNRIALFDGTFWTLRAFAEISIAVPASTSQMYDVWVFDNAGTIALELLAWTNDTTRATALTTQDGIFVKTGATTRRYVGSFRTTTVSGQTEDSAAKRYVWNYYNRSRRPLARTESTASWTYSTATIRQANGAAANQVEMVIGVQESTMDLTLSGMPVVNNSGAATALNIGIGEDSTSTFAVLSYFGSTGSAAVTNYISAVKLVKYPAIGRHFYSWNEYSAANATTTWYGNTTFGGANVTTGLTGWIEG